MRFDDSTIDASAGSEPSVSAVTERLLRSKPSRLRFLSSTPRRVVASSILTIFCSAVSNRRPPNHADRRVSLFTTE